MASCSISGWSGANRTYTLTVTESSYNAKNNTSVVSWTLSSTGSSTHYDYYLYASVNGTQIFNSSGAWSSAEFPATTGSRSGTMTITHNADGKKSISFYIEGYAYVYSTKSASGSLTLTNIDRTAPTITAGNASNITINSFNITATANTTCWRWAYRIKPSGGSYGSWLGWADVDATSHAFSVTGLSSNTSYVIQLAGYKKSNDVWGYSAEKTVKTLGASTITSVSNTTIGNSCAVKWTPLNSSFRFKVKFSCGSWSYTTGYISPNTTSAYTYNYTIPMTVCNQITQATTGTLTCVLTTYNGTAQVGSTSSKTATLTVPSSVVPTISGVTIAEGTASGYGVFCKSLSTVKATISASGAYGSTIKDRTMTVESKTYTANSSGVATSNPLTTYGTVAVKSTVTDSRGRTATRTDNITVYNYFLPSVTIDLNVYGETVTTTVSGSIASVNNLNQKRLTIVRRKVVDDTTETYTINPLDSYNFSETWTQTIEDAGRETYEYTVTVSDTKNSAVARKLTGIICISRLAGGLGVRLFGEAENQGFWVGNIDYTITDAEYTTLDSLIGSW